MHWRVFDPVHGDPYQGVNTRTLTGLAEGEGSEPPCRVNDALVSNQAQSASLATFHSAGDDARDSNPFAIACQLALLDADPAVVRCQ